MPKKKKKRARPEALSYSERKKIEKKSRKASAPMLLFCTLLFFISAVLWVLGTCISIVNDSITNREFIIDLVFIGTFAVLTVVFFVRWILKRKGGPAK